MPWPTRCPQLATYNNGSNNGFHRHPEGKHATIRANEGQHALKTDFTAAVGKGHMQHAQVNRAGPYTLTKTSTQPPSITSHIHTVHTSSSREPPGRTRTMCARPGAHRVSCPPPPQSPRAAPAGRGPRPVHHRRRRWPCSRSRQCGRRRGRRGRAPCPKLLRKVLRRYLRPPPTMVVCW